MTGTGSRTHAVAPPTAAQEVTSRSARRRHVVLRPEKGTVRISFTAQVYWSVSTDSLMSYMHMCVMSSGCSRMPCVKMLRDENSEVSS
jgi:hypothetical protein